MKKHFVEFYSPGTFVDEATIKEIDSWNVDEAVKMARSVSERYGATPHSFRFITRGRGPDDLDSKIINKSPSYYLGGIVETFDEIKARNDPNERILLENMKSNGWYRVITNTNSYKVTKPLFNVDVVLDFTL